MNDNFMEEFKNECFGVIQQFVGQKVNGITHAHLTYALEGLMSKYGIGGSLVLGHDMQSFHIEYKNEPYRNIIFNCPQCLCCAKLEALREREVEEFAKALERI